MIHDSSAEAGPNTRTDGHAPPFLPRGGGGSVAVRLCITVWLVYTIHFASNVVRETYLAVALGEKFSVRVDDFMGLHPDLFEIPGRGAYINSNPGASFLAAVPYALARPAITMVLRAKPELSRPKPPTSYDDPRPNRTRFMNEMRARGLDVKLALAAMATHFGLMTPLAVLAALAVFLSLRRRLRDERAALWFALLYAFGTPIFFRSAFLNHNEIVAHCVLLAFLLLTETKKGKTAGGGTGDLRMAGAGALLGLAVLCDYSGVALIVPFGVWIVSRALGSAGVGEAMRQGAVFSLGALPALVALFGYQWVAFGNPLYPAQHYMPDTLYSTRGMSGFSLPTVDLLWRNLFDPAYGLFAFCPMLLAAFSAPFFRSRGVVSRSELWLIFSAFAGLYLFSSANQFASLQWNTGVRYLVPAVPLLFYALVPVLSAIAPGWRYALVIPTVAISWSVSMARESVPVSLGRIFLGGFELPFLTVLRKTASAYAPFLSEGVSPLPIFALVGVILWLVWRMPVRRYADDLR